jgi:hypothetical protein
MKVVSFKLKYQTDAFIAAAALIASVLSFSNSAGASACSDLISSRPSAQVKLAARPGVNSKKSSKSLSEAIYYSEAAGIRYAAIQALDRNEPALARVLYLQFKEKFRELSEVGFDISQLARFLRLQARTEEVKETEQIRLVQDSVESELKLSLFKIATLSAHEATVNFAAFNHIGSLAVTAGEDFSARIWDANTGRLLKKIVTSEGVRFAAFSPDSKRLLTSGHRHSELWDVQNGVMLNWFADHEWPTSFASFSSDGKKLIVAGAGTSAIIYDLTTGQELITFNGGHLESITFMLFNEDGTRVLTTGDDNRNICIWDAQTGSLISSHRIFGRFIAARFLEDGFVYASSTRREILIRDQNNHKVGVPLRGHKMPSYVGSFPTSDKGLFVSGDEGGVVILWKIETGLKLVKIEPKTKKKFDYIQSVVLSDDGSKIIMSSTDHDAHIWQR